MRDKEKIAEYMRKYQLENKEKLKEQHREYYQKNKEVIKERKREYYLKHKKAVLERCRKYYQGNKERTKARRKKARLEKPWVDIFYHIKQRCNNPSDGAYKWYGGKGVECLVTADEIRTLYLRDGARNMKRPSIDRIYNDGNYRFGNCRFIEKSENIARAQRERWRKWDEYNKILRRKNE